MDPKQTSPSPEQTPPAEESTPTTETQTEPTPEATPEPTTETAPAETPAPQNESEKDENPKPVEPIKEPESAPAPEPTEVEKVETTPETPETEEGSIEVKEETIEVKEKEEQEQEPETPAHNKLEAESEPQPTPQPEAEETTETPENDPTPANDVEPSPASKEDVAAAKKLAVTEQPEGSEEYNSSTTEDDEFPEGNDSEQAKQEDLSQMDLKDVLKLNSTKIDFGFLTPGQIIEETVIILNNLTFTKVPFKIKINCLSKEFDDLDEYVYSMRRPTTQDVFNYNDTFLILLAQKAISYYKLAIKVPNITEEKEILGNIEISCNECKNGVITIPIKSTICKNSLL